jgi:5-methylcytosine-specific restriction endonuclease McrA
MHTLVLSQSFVPLARISWQRALVLVLERKAEIVEEYEDWTVHSVTLEFKVPSIIRFLKKVFGQKQSVRFSRENVYARDKGRCQYCGCKVRRSELTYDHVIPRRLGGHTCWTNITLSCYPCNQRKGGRTPAQAGMKLLSVPVRPKRLSETFRLTLRYRKDMPESWASWLRSVAYWNETLDED